MNVCFFLPLARGYKHTPPQIKETVLLSVCEFWREKARNWATACLQLWRISTVATKEKMCLTSGKATLTILKIITSYRTVTRSLPSIVSTYPVQCCSADSRFPGTAAPPLTDREDVATSGLAPVLLSPVESLSIKALAPTAADRMRPCRCTGTRPHIRPVDGAELQASLHTVLEAFSREISAEEIIQVINESISAARFHK